MMFRTMILKARIYVAGQMLEKLCKYLTNTVIMALKWGLPKDVLQKLQEALSKLNKIDLL